MTGGAGMTAVRVEARRMPIIFIFDKEFTHAKHEEYQQVVSN
jgi:hypothetical protein